MQGNQEEKKPKNLLTDEQSPYQSAPQKIKQILGSAFGEDGTLNIEKIDLSKLQFPIKERQANFCQKKIQSGQTYYICNTCSCRTQTCFFLFCKECYQPDQHLDHQVETKEEDQNFCTCDCGFVQRIDSTRFCKQHSNYNIQIQCNIDQNDSDRFQKYFISLFECAIYSENDELFQLITKQLIKLNTNIYYNRLTFELLSKQCRSKIKDQQKYKQFLAKIIDNRLLTQLICGDLKTRKNLFKLVCQFIDHTKARNQDFTPFDTNNVKQIISFTVIQQLLNEGYFHPIIVYLLKNIRSDFNQKRIGYQATSQKMLNTLLNKQISNQILIQLLRESSSYSFQSLLNIISKIVSLFPEKEVVRKFVRGQQNEEENPWAKIQLIQNKQQESISKLPSLANKIINLFVKKSSQMIALNSLNDKTFKKALLDKGIKQQKLNQVIYWVATGAGELLKEANQQKQITLITLLIIVHSSDSQQLAKKMHQSLFKCKENQDQQQVENIGRIVQEFYYVLSILFLSDIWVMIKKNKIQKNLGLQIKDNQQVTQFLRDWFRNFLYSKKQISQQGLVELKTQGILSFSGVGEILDQLCSYNQQQEIFNYSSTKVCKSLMSEFPLIPTRNDFNSIYSTQIRYGQNISLKQGTLSKDLISVFLSSNVVLELFGNEWKNYLLKEQKRTDQKYAYIYFFFLTVYNILTNGQNKQIKQQIQNFRSNQSLLKDFTTNQSQIQQIKKLLNYQLKNTEQIQKEKKQKQDQDLKKKKARAEQIKKKKAEQMKKKRLLFIDKISSFKDAKSINQDEQVCILCHEKRKQGDDIVYVGSINKKTICNALYGKENKSSTLINTCFHALHIKCYISKQKNSDQSFKCPLCQAYTNFILPIQYFPKNKKLNKVIFNVKIVSMISSFKIYDPQSDFMLIFKHLVEAKGLNALIYKPLYLSKLMINKKRDIFLKAYMLEIYKTSDQQKKVQYEKDIQSFIKEIQTCQNQLVRNVQLLFAEALKAVVILGDIDVATKLLLNIKKSLKTSEYEILEDHFNQIFDSQQSMIPNQESNVTVNENPASLSLPQISFPQTAKQFRQKYRNKKCEKCLNNKMQTICLFCGKNFCGNCVNQHSQKNHSKNNYEFNINQLTLNYINAKQNKSECLYENQLRIKYNYRTNYDQKLFKQEQFRLNAKKLIKMNMQFLNN